MLRIGLTGGIGCGKSSVSAIFRELGAAIVDSDVIARQIVHPGSEALTEITRRFGSEVLNRDGSLDRARMRKLVFHDANKRQELEALLHPLIRQEMLRQIAALDCTYVIVAIPLLLEKGWQELLDRILVVDCSEEQQLERSGSRDGSTADTIRRIINSQIGRRERLAAADDIIDNSGSIDSLRPQIEALHKRYLEMALHN